MTTIDFWNLLTSSISTILAAIAILLYIIIWRKDKLTSNYDVFDATYMELLKTGLEFPQFRSEEFTIQYKTNPNKDEIIRYETYAFMIWNFCETIFDKSDEKLMETWRVILETENKLHRTWFDQPENFGKFKDSFRKYVNQHL
jgi:hypothetical protein